jgi:hypothetical protein
MNPGHAGRRIYGLCGRWLLLLLPPDETPCRAPGRGHFTSSQYSLGMSFETRSRSQNRIRTYET